MYGFEIAYQQHFSRLPGALNGLGVSTNYGYTASQAKLPRMSIQPCFSRARSVGQTVALEVLFRRS